MHTKTAKIFIAAVLKISLNWKIPMSIKWRVEKEIIVQ